MCPPRGFKSTPCGRRLGFDTCRGPTLGSPLERNERGGRSNRPDDARPRIKPSGSALRSGCSFVPARSRKIGPNTSQSAGGTLSARPIPAKRSGVTSSLTPRRASVRLREGARCRPTDARSSTAHPAQAHICWGGFGIRQRRPQPCRGQFVHDMAVDAVAESRGQSPPPRWSPPANCRQPRWHSEVLRTRARPSRGIQRTSISTRQQQAHAPSGASKHERFILPLPAHRIPRRYWPPWGRGRSERQGTTTRPSGRAGRRNIDSATHGRHKRTGEHASVARVPRQSPCTASA